MKKYVLLCLVSMTILWSYGQIVVTGNVTNPTCFGSDDGSIDITVTGGNPPYTYIWSNGSTNEDLFNIGGGEYGMQEYIVTVTDASSSEQIEWFSTTEPMAIWFDIVTTNSNCGNSDGQAMINGLDTQNGIYEAYWSTGDIGLDLFNLSSGTYSVEVKDIATGCSTFKYFVIEDNTSNVINQTTINPSCYECNDGVISIDVTNGNGPYTINWNNGFEGAINTNLLAGDYSVTVTDANQCINTLCISIWNNTPFDASSSVDSASACGLSDGSAQIYAYGGVPPYNYQWDDASLQTSDIASNLSAGFYHCTVSDQIGAQKILTVAVGEAGGPSITYMSSGDADCGQENGFVNISITGGSGSYNYMWSNGQFNQNLSNVGAGTYSVYVNDGTCKSASLFWVSESSSIQEQSICIVTVDSITDHNLIVWEKSQAVGVDHYNVYRENCSGGYSLIGSVATDAITVYEDISSVPFERSYAYKLTAVDACGTESIMSAIHKTIHLEINLNEGTGEAQLNWDDYMGFANPIFKIYKKFVDTGWALLDEVSGTTFSYIDPNYNDLSLSYAVVVEKQDGGCDAWNGNAKATGGPYYQSVSNLEDEGIINHTQTSTLKNSELSVYPNPSNAVLKIENTENIESIRIYNLSGQLVKSFTNINQKQIKLNTSLFAPGVYTIEIQSDQLVKERIIIE